LHQPLPPHASGAPVRALDKAPAVRAGRSVIRAKPESDPDDGGPRFAVGHGQIPESPGLGRKDATRHELPPHSRPRAVQSTQVSPPVPQATSEAPGRQVPLGPQQPRGQVSAVHPHEPATGPPVMTHVPCVSRFMVKHWSRGISAPHPSEAPSITVSMGAKSAAEDRPARIPPSSHVGDAPACCLPHVFVTGFSGLAATRADGFPAVGRPRESCEQVG
jgi:hypothetical protein